MASIAAVRKLKWKNLSQVARMSTHATTTPKSSPFTRAVVSSMRKLYPEALADKSFDNTGLLLEAPFSSSNGKLKNSVLLTIDLTKAVVDEAIERGDSVVVAYHPIIFKGLKSFTLADTQQQSLLRLAQAGISVYSPHTAVDAAPGGLGDWLADIVTNSLPAVEYEDTSTSGSETGESREHPFSRKALAKGLDSRVGSEPSKLKSGPLDHSRRVIQPAAAIEGFPNAGFGRLVTFAHEQPLHNIIKLIAEAVGNPRGFPVAIPQGGDIDKISIRTVAVCAGSGGSVFKGVEADLLFTGELSHHEALVATENGKCVVTLFHSNSERGYLNDVMRGSLESKLVEEWAAVRAEEDGEWEAEVAVDTSLRDRDPYGIIILESSTS